MEAVNDFTFNHVIYRSLAGGKLGRRQESSEFHSGSYEECQSGAEVEVCDVDIWPGQAGGQGSPS